MEDKPLSQACAFPGLLQKTVTNKMTSTIHIYSLHFWSEEIESVTGPCPFQRFCPQTIFPASTQCSLVILVGERVLEDRVTTVGRCG